MQDLNKKIQLAIILILITSFSLFLLGIYPLFLKIKTTSEQLLEVRQETNFLKAKSMEASTLKEKIEQLNPDLLKVQGVFTSETPIEFFQFLENLAKESNVLFDVSLNPQTSKKEEIFPFLNIQLSFQGSFSNCLKFLQQLEASPYLIEIQNFTLQRIGEEELKTTKEEEKKLSMGDAKANLLIKVFSK